MIERLFSIRSPLHTKRADDVEQLTSQIAKGGVIAFLGTVIGKTVTFALHILLGRVLGPGTYGLFALGITVTGVAQPIASLGLQRGVVRFCAMYRRQGDKASVKGTILSALAICLLSSIFVTGMLWVLSGLIAEKLFNEPNLTWVLRVFALAVPFHVLMEITTSFAQSFKRIDYQQAVRNIMRPLVDLALVGIVFLLGFRLAGAIYGYLGSGMLGAGLGFYFLWKIFPEIKSSIRPAYGEVYKLILFSLPMTFVTISYLLALRIDRIMLGIFCDVEDVGTYVAAANIALQVSIIHSALVSIFMPTVSSVYGKQQFCEMKDLYTVVKRWSSYGTLFLILPMIFFPKIVMSIYGSEFVEGWLILMVLSTAYIVNAVAGPTGALLQMTGRQNIEFFNGFLMVITNLILNCFLIPAYGYVGAAIATLLSVSLMNAVQIVFIWKIFRFHPFDFKHFGFIVLMSIIFALAVTVNLFANLYLRLLVLLLGLGLVVVFGYHSRTKQDRITLDKIKLRLASGGLL